jgi:hypothetical protein
MLQNWTAIAGTPSVGTVATWPAQLFSRDQWPHILQGGILPAVVALGCRGHSTHHSTTLSGPGNQRPFSGMSLPPAQDLAPPPSAPLAPPPPPLPHPPPPPLPMAVACRMGLSRQPMTSCTCLATAREKRNAKCLRDMKQQPRQTLVDKSGSVASQAHQTNGPSQTRPPIAGSSPGAPSSGPSARAAQVHCLHSPEPRPSLSAYTSIPGDGRKCPHHTNWRHMGHSPLMELGEAGRVADQERRFERGRAVVCHAHGPAEAW